MASNNDIALKRIMDLLNTLPDLLQKGSMLNFNQDMGSISKSAYEKRVRDIADALPQAIKDASRIVNNEQNIIDGAKKFANDTRIEFDQKKQKLELAIKRKMAETDNKSRQLLEEAENNHKSIIRKANEEQSVIINNAQMQADEIIASAEKEAHDIVEDARLEARRLVEESQIVEEAKLRADAIIQEAELNIDDKYMQVHNHIANLLDEVEGCLMNQVKSIRVIKSQIVDTNQMHATQMHQNEMENRGEFGNDFSSEFTSEFSPTYGNDFSSYEDYPLESYNDNVSPQGYNDVPYEQF